MSISSDPSGNKKESLRCCEEGAALRRQRRLEEAIPLLRKALTLDESNASAWNELAHALRWQGQNVEAQAAAIRATEISPGLAPAWFNLGAVLADTGHHEQAVAHYQRALALQPDFAEAWSNLGIALSAGGKATEGIVAFRRALDVNPQLVPVWNNLGSVLIEQGHTEDAIAAYRRALQLDSQYVQAWSNLADALAESGNFEAAIEACEKALALDSTFAPAWNNLGAARNGAGKFADAIPAFQTALKFDASVAQSWNGLGNAFLRSGNVSTAITAFKRSTEIANDDARWWRNLAHAYWTDGQLNEAVAALRQAAALQPAHAGIAGDLVYLLLSICEWRDLDDHLAVLANELSATPVGEEETPHGNLIHCEDENINQAVARRWAMRVSARFPATSAHARGARARDKLTIGYLSCDMHDHATAHLMRGVFACHDKTKMRINVYSYGPDDHSHYRAEIADASTVFRDIRNMSHRDAAARIAEDGVDILVDLKGWTQGARQEICALRPAPLQITYLGFPGSCAADFIDYAIVDAEVVPPGSARHYTEQLIYMPHCYQCNDNGQIIAAGMSAREEFGLPSQGVVFCSFNGSQKLDPVMFAAWMRILRQVPDAVLWLYVNNPWAVENLKREAHDRGVAATRLVFAKGLPKAQHLRRLQLADIALDTRIYNGHTTTSDALWAGAPVVTLHGRHFASRVSASCLHAIGLPELVTESLSDYETLAIKLAQDGKFLRATRQKLLDNRLSQPLFDTARFTRNLERAYRQAWQQCQAGLPPRSFAVEEA